MNQHPYKSLPDHAFWRRAVSGVAPSEIDPVVSAGFSIDRADKVATAGSCFAQHIARYLKQSGYNYLVTETAHPLVAQDAEKFNYGLFTARYGNIYTSRQLLQLFDRAFGEFVPEEDVWQGENGGVIDALRPTIQPGGFPNIEELVSDRNQHLAAVRQAFRTLDVFVFTLGLTECWRSRADGLVYPICPGVSGGRFDPEKHEFLNLSVDEIVSDLQDFVHKLRSINPSSRVVLTVSPVPLAASASGKHVLTATTLSKSILRVAAEIACTTLPKVFYFPSYEIVTGAFARGAYFAPDLRSVTEPAVEHVMFLFLKHATVGESGILRSSANDESLGQAANDRFLGEMSAWVQVMCDEEALDPEEGAI
ncbi:GSCFA domain-containing protein [Pseudoxanthomonas yeongjuensis]|uniref:GSCFA domain-containing protein n=1 Tax=Pseudoxanthomonas yeongjuensis TaxID=377616 RepID=UPI0013908BB5|nr:GSCFA domain-containing protein [Pseudoxanthomonas yeongjuensis]KAF1717812.1 GSCFA domain-containing protein [Pseudoxanthomonas yeongjuensis]